MKMVRICKVSMARQPIYKVQILHKTALKFKIAENNLWRSFGVLSIFLSCFAEL